MKDLLRKTLDKKEKLENKIERERLEKIKKIIRISNQIKLDMMRNILDLDSKMFDNKILDWASEFGFTIDGDYLIINKNTVSDFINMMDEQYAMWEKSTDKGE